MNSTSPPVPVTARPVATPGTGPLGRLEEELLAAQVAAHVAVVDDQRGGHSPEAILVAALRSSLPISRSRLRTPASRV